MTDSDEAPQETPRRPRYKRIRKKDSWLRDRHDLTKEEKSQWDDADFPPHLEIVAGFLMSNNLIFGVPDKKEICRLDMVRKVNERNFGPPEHFFEDALRLHYVQPSPIPSVYYTLAHPPLGVEMGDIVEVNYNVRLQALIRQMVLTNITLIHGSLTDNDPKIVFEGTELPGPAMHRQIRVVRVTVHTEDYATWETVSESTYPKSIF